MKEQEEIKDEKVWDIDREKALERRSGSATWSTGILDHLIKTKRETESPTVCTSSEYRLRGCFARDRSKIDEVNKNQAHRFLTPFLQ